MTAAELALVVIGVLALIGVILVHLAQRVDRLHRRVLRTRAVLETQLVRRAEAAVELAAGDVLDPAGAVIVGESAWNAAVHAPRLVGGADDAEQDELASTGVDRGLVESELTMNLRAALGTADDLVALRTDPACAAALERLEQACYRAELARRFHNDAVVATRHLRANPLVRIFRLAGHAAMPVTFEMDDEVFVGTGPGSG